MSKWAIGDEIEVIDQRICGWPLRGRILELDLHPLSDNFAKIELTNSPALPVPKVWVNLRLAKHAGKL